MPTYEIITKHRTITITHTEMILIALLVVWEIAWKLAALWRAARNKQLGWFIAMTIINSFGILEIAYISFFQKKQPAKDETK